MMGTDDMAYIAGLFDGEGCVTCKQKPTNRKDRGGKIYNQWYIRCEIAMTDKYVVEWIYDTLGFGWFGDFVSSQHEDYFSFFNYHFSDRFMSSY